MSGAGRHDFIDDYRPRQRLEYYIPIICLHCGARVWREKGTGHVKIGEGQSGDMRSLSDEEKGCEFFIVKHVMEI